MVQGFRGRKEDKCELGKRRKKRLSKRRRMAIYENWNIRNCAIYCFSSTIGKTT